MYGISNYGIPYRKYEGKIIGKVWIKRFFEGWVLTGVQITDRLRIEKENESIKQSKFYQHNKKWLTQTEGIHDWVFDNNPYGYNEQMLDPRMWESEDDYD